MSFERRDVFICPHCGADVPTGAAACPACGSDENTGWSDAAGWDGSYIGDDDEAPQRLAAAPWMRYLIAVMVWLLVTATLANFLDTGAILALTLLLLALVAAYFTGRPRADDEEQDLYRALLSRAQGDDALAERLIAYERSRRPMLSRAEHIADALDRWERDRR